MTREQLLLRASLPIRVGGLGLRPVSRILTAAYYSALVAALPELLRMCPELHSSGNGPEGHSQQIRSTEIYAELAELREELLATGAFHNRKERRQHMRDVAAVDKQMTQLQQNAPPPDPPPPFPGLSLVPPPTTASAVAAAAAPATATAPAAVPAAPVAADVAATSTSSFSFSILNKDTDALWRAASKSAQGGVALLAYKFMPAEQLQQRITEVLEEHLHEKTHAVLGSYQQAIVTSLNSAAQSGAFLSVLPTERAYRMTDEQMCLAIRSRLGMLPALSLRTESCISCHARNTVHEPRFEDDPEHFQACLGRAPPGASCTARHHRIAGEVAHAARQAGYSVVREPPFDSVVATTTSIDPMTGLELDQERIFHDTERGDLLLIRGDERLLIDVTIVRPTARTHLRNPRLKVTECGLACAAAAERAKHAKYDALCKQRRWKMIPFAMESHGAVGESACQLLFKLASKVSDISAQAFLQQTYARLSVALQSANAAIMVGGLQRLRMDQLSSNDLPMSPGLGHRTFPSRRRSVRCRPGATVGKGYRRFPVT